MLASFSPVTRVGQARPLPYMDLACPTLATQSQLWRNNYFGGSQFCAASAGISLNFLISRCHRFRCENAEPRFVAAYTHRRLWRADAIACLAPHKHFHQSIL